MRTTLAIDDDILERVRQYADSSGLPLGRAATALLRHGLDAPFPTKLVRGQLVFDPPPGTPIVTDEMVYRALDEL